MNKSKIFGTWLLLLMLTSFTSDRLPEPFKALLERGNLVFVKPEGFEEIKTIPNRPMNYEYAIKHNKKEFEVRYAIRPLDSAVRDYKEWENTKKEGDRNIHPNKWHATSLQTVILNITGGSLPEIGEYDEKAVKSEFNADWGGTTAVEVHKEFGQKYKYCMVVAIHKENLADAYIFYLSDTKEEFLELMRPAFYSLKFK